MKMQCINCQVNVSTIYCTNCGAKVAATSFELEVTKYFRKGFTYTEIINLLERQHDVKISMRTLKKKLKSFGLKRKNHSITHLSRAIDIVTQQVSTLGSSVGYRTIWHNLSHDFGINVPRDLIMLTMRELDPIGASTRKVRSLKRRIYHSDGPNYLWHSDGYDKLKHFGFPIHGCIDGFSRKILWLRVLTSNNNPHVIESLYLDTVEDLGMYPRCVRTDCGSENGLVAASQCYFHQNSGFIPHIYGSSHHNQRIEAWWSQFRRMKSGFMIDFFKEMVDEGLYNCGNEFQKACAFYCFGVLIQGQLDACKEQWNSHYIRQSQCSEVHGRPDYLFVIQPEHFQEYGTDINPEDLSVIKDHVNEFISVEDLEEQHTYVEYFDYAAAQLHLPECSNFNIPKNNFLSLLEASQNY